MIFNIITLFPEMFEGVFTESILSRAEAAGLIGINIMHLRPYGIGRHKICDDTPYGEGA